MADESVLFTKLHQRFREAFGPANHDLYDTEQWSLIPSTGHGAINVLLNGTRQGPLVWVFDSRGTKSPQHFAVKQHDDIDALIKELTSQVTSANVNQAQVKRRRGASADALTTEELAKRPSRSPGYIAENDAVLALAERMASNPMSILQMIVDTAMQLCRGDSAGISILERRDGKEFFRWKATTGAFAAHAGNIMPRNSPCGTVIDRNALLLMDRPELHYEFPMEVDLPIEEVILAPFHSCGKLIGTLWVISHSKDHRFDREDARLLGDLTMFAGAAYQIVTALESAEAGRAQMASARDQLMIHGDELEAIIAERTGELAESNRKLLLSERMVAMGTLSAGLGHDMGNMVLAMRARLEIIQKSAESVNEHTQVLGDCVTYIHNLATGLRLMALNPNDHKRLGPDRVSISSWWIAAHRVLASGTTLGIELKCNIAENLPDVAVNRAGLTQAVYNLVQNAVDAMKGMRGSITIAAALDASGSNVLLSVTDEGPGMTEEVRERCLEAYYSTKTTGTSSGLGLALVQNVMKTSNGKIEIKSAPGKGASFILHLRVAKPAAGNETDEPVAEELNS
jgi:signal transduction histidine kinase